MSKLQAGIVPVVDVRACRVCFATDCKLYLMTANKVLSKTYETLTGLLVENEDSLPPYLCPGCARRLVKCARFRNTSLQAHLVLLEIIKNHGCVTLDLIKSIKDSQDPFGWNQADSDRSDNGIEIEVADNEHMNTDDPSSTNPRLPEYVAVDCIKVENDDVTNENIHNDEETTEDVLCTSILPEYVAVDHIKVENDDSNDQQFDAEVIGGVKAENEGVMNQDSANGDSDYTDMGLEDAFLGEGNSTDDILALAESRRKAVLNTAGIQLTVVPRESTLQDSDRLSSNGQPQLLNHLKVYATREFYSCNTCSYVTMKKHILRRHFKIHSDEKLYSCDVCNKSFNRKDYLTKHLRIHFGKKPYSCNVCNKLFNQKDRLKIHLRTHSGERPYSCEICNKTFNREDRLSKHLRIHSGERPYPCDVCKKAFTYRSALREHLRIHSGEKPFSCNVCCKAFAAQSAFRGHMRIHSGEKPYSCNVCNKTFNQKTNLTTHLRIHSGVKPYSCEICNKSFNRKDQVKKHLRVHSGEKPYACNVCNKAFNQKANLTRHAKTH